MPPGANSGMTQPRPRMERCTCSTAVGRTKSKLKNHSDETKATVLNVRTERQFAIDADCQLAGSAAIEMCTLTSPVSRGGRTFQTIIAGAAGWANCDVTTANAL